MVVNGMTLPQQKSMSSGTHADSALKKGGYRYNVNSKPNTNSNTKKSKRGGNKFNWGCYSGGKKTKRNKKYKKK